MNNDSDFFDEPNGFGYSTNYRIPLKNPEPVPIVTENKQKQNTSTNINTQSNTKNNNMKNTSQKNMKNKKKSRKNPFPLLVVLVVIAFAAVNHFKGQADDDYFDYESNSYHNKNNINAPQAWSSDEIEEYLYSLAQTNTKFSEVYDNMDSYPPYLLQALCNNPDMIDFVLGYLSGDGDVVFDTLNRDVPLYIQWDSRWGYEQYGDDIIALSGCGPTCLAMVSSALTNKDITPDRVADYAEVLGYYEYGSGTSWSLMTEGCRKFGVRSEELPLTENAVYESLEDGNPIICSVSAGDFTLEGHFIVLCGLEDGMIQVNDPNNVERSERLWSYDELEWQIRNLWSFSKA